MSIHTLHDLCYAYAVADPVREMLFALQDGIDALEAQRKPLSDGQIIRAANALVFTNLNAQMQYIAFARAIEQAHNIKEGT